MLVLEKPTLNQGQEEAVDLMLEWLDQPCHPFFTLYGKGGVGKTFTVKEFLRRSRIYPKEVCLSAPTNNLVNMLCDGLEGYHGIVIHSLLGYYPRETSSEHQILVKGGRKDRVKLVPFKLVVLDEAPYTPAVLMDAIFTHYPHIKWLFLGHHRQLPPVGEAASYLLEVDDQIKYKYTLTQNMRAACQEQETLMDTVCEKGWDTDFSPYIVKKSVATRKMMELAENKADFCFLAYQHKVVDSTASFIRQCVYDVAPNDPPQKGEIIRVSGCADIDGNILTRPNEVVTVLHWQPDSISVRRSSGDVEILPIDVNNEIERLYQIASASRDPGDWKKYHLACRYYVTIRSKFASTVHSYQGLTTDHAIIDLTDVGKCNLEQLLYVAISRSRTIPTLFY